MVNVRTCCYFKRGGINNMRKALVVGINDYPSASLKGCINDANDVTRLLERNGDGSPNFDVRAVNDIPTKGQLLSLIDELFAGDSDIALFYYSGHGFINELGGYLVTPDFQSKYDMGVSMNDILVEANKSKCKNRIIILDCCHAGALGECPSIKDDATIIGQGVTILTASRNSESAVEIGGHGVFTNLLLAALDGGAADLNGNVTPGSIYAYIDQALGEWEQRPMFKTNITRFISLRKVEAQVPVEVLRRLTTYFPDPCQPHRLDPSYEYTNSPNVEHKYLEPYAIDENVRIFKDLQLMESVGLVIPIDEEHMYYAAMNSTGCKLTPVGQCNGQAIL